MILSILKMLGGPLINMAKGGLAKFQERKQTAQDARVAWETVAGRSMIDSWKDEYLTVVVTWPLIAIPIAAIMSVFTDKGAEVMQAITDSLEQIGYLLETPYGDIVYIVVLAGVGIKVSQRFVK